MPAAGQPESRPGGFDAATKDQTTLNMRDSKLGSFSDRLNSQAEARKALLEKFKPKPTVRPETFETREQRKARELEEVRAKRATDKEAARLKAEAEAEAARLALENDEQHQLDLKRQERKDRKSVAKADARARREAKSAQRR
jgi:hypothetical protein